MKTKEQIKNEYAVINGFESWYSLLLLAPVKYITKFENEVMEIYAMECLKLASENAMIDGNMFSRCGCELDKESIINENNIIK